MQVERREIVDRKQWLEWRREHVTASNIGALFNEHPYTTVLRLYAEKRGTEFPEMDADNKILRRGRWLEPAVGLAVAERCPQWQVVPSKYYLCDPVLKLGATPDFDILGDARGPGVLQTKTASPQVYERDWGGGSEVPLWINLQCATEMMLADAAFGAIAVLLVDAHRMDIAVHEIPRNPDAEHKIRLAVRMFWDSVDNGIEPLPDFARDTETIKALLPRETPGKTIDLSGNNAVPGMLEERAALADAIKDAGDRRDAIDTELKFLMGDAERAVGVPGWGLTFKAIDRAGYTVQPKTVRSLRVSDRREQS